jgi:UDP-glucose 4-epimerase
MKVFISGVAGFLGSHLADRLAAKGHAVVGCDSLVHGGSPENVSSEIEFHVCDVRDISKVSRLLRGVEVVFHAAALGHDGFSVFSPHVISENIFSTTSSLVSAAAANGVRRFVYCSSMARYGAQPGPFVEEMPPAPVTPYGVAKVAGENLVRSVCNAHSMEWTVCVPHNIIGPRQKYDDPYRNVVSIMTNRILQGLPPIIFGDGEQRRSFTSIWDILSVLEPLIFSPLSVGQVVNLGPDEEFVSINHIYREISRILGSTVAPMYVSARHLEVADANCSADKSRHLFGYETRVRLTDALKESVEWIVRQGPKSFSYNLPVEILTQKTPQTWLTGVSSRDISDSSYISY